MKEYRTRIQLLGLPLVHMASRSRRHERPVGVARGWIAVGDRAFGAAIAVGNIAVAPVAMGGLAIGVISLSLVAFGGFAVGACSLAVWSWGGVALGLQAAAGAIAVASCFADGVVAVAEHVNDPGSDEFFGGALPYVLLDRFLERPLLVLGAMGLLLAPALLLRLRRDNG